jgi:sigma-E factor negative regulatory protein RseA
MSQPDPDRSSSRRILSALADGDATDSESARAFQAWREDDDARATWHAYQLIGDVMRSDDLAAEPAADQAFLVALRARLATEPVVLAPQVSTEEVAARPHSAVANARSGAWTRGRWQAPLAMAAGFLAVIGGINIVRPFGHAGPTLALATGAAPASSAATVAGNGIVATSVQAKADAEQLAPYLAAHRQSTMNGAFQMPGGDIRNVSLVQPAP